MTLELRKVTGTQIQNHGRDTRDEFLNLQSILSVDVDDIVIRRNSIL